jgi:hypothetical protein
MTGTEGWVKYSLDVSGFDDRGDPLSKEQVYVYWQNPYVGTPVVPRLSGNYGAVVSTSDIKPDCDAPGDGGSGNQFPSPAAGHELFLMGFGVAADSWLGDSWMNVVPAFSNPITIITEFFRGNNDHVWVALALRRKGSVRQSLPLRYAFDKGLRPLAAKARTSNLRTLFSVPIAVSVTVG